MYVPATIKKKCEFFYELHEFMGSYAAVVPPYLSDVLSGDSHEQLCIDELSASASGEAAAALESDFPSPHQRPHRPATKRRNESASNEDFLGAVMNIAREALELQRSELQFKRRRFEEESRLRMKKMELEQEQFFKQMELKYKASANKKCSDEEEKSS